MRRCFSLIKSYPECRMVVVSATYNTTNQLEVLGQLSREGNIADLQLRWNQLVKKHHDILEDFSLEQIHLNELFSEYEAYLLGLATRKSCNAEEMDRLYAFGELCSSIIFSKALEKEGIKTKWLDARKFLKTDSEFQSANPNPELIKKEMTGFLDQTEGVYITQGYIGTDLEGRVTTLGREGSDYSATLIGEAMAATEVVIWTDVDGIWSADPRLVPDAHKIDSLSYNQAQFLAEGGAKVLFPRTLDPARRAKMKVRVASSFDKNLTGTTITNDQSLVRAQAIDMYDEHFSVLTYLGSNNDFSFLKTFSPELELQEETADLIRFRVPHSIALDMFRETHAALRKTDS